MDSKVQTPKDINKEQEDINFIVDKTIIELGSENIWSQVNLEPKTRTILYRIYQKRNMFVTSVFYPCCRNLWKSSYICRWRWYLILTSLSVFETPIHNHSSLEKSLILRSIQYIKDKIEGFNDYFSCRKKNCKLKHEIMAQLVCISLCQKYNVLTLQIWSRKLYIF